MEAIIRYAAKKAFEDIRARGKLDDDLIAELHTAPAMNYLRVETKTEDIPLLKQLAETGSEPIHKLAVGILKDRKDFTDAQQKEIRELFMSLWESRPEPPKIRINLMWRLLDYKDLPPEWHPKIYEFVCSHWKDFIETQRGYMGEGRSDTGEGDSNVVLKNVEERLNNKQFPCSKHWAYFCSTMASDDIPGRLRLFAKYGQNHDQFTNAIIEDLRKRCDEEDRSARSSVAE